MRPTKDEYFLAMARLVACRATCARRSVGCVLVNERGHVLSTGYNGRQSGVAHCRDGELCQGAHSPTGLQLDACEAIHAEQNALLQCRDVWAVDTCYTTASPCITCAKLLLNTSCKRVVYIDEYPAHIATVRDLWKDRELVQGRDIRVDLYTVPRNLAEAVAFYHT